MEKRIKTAQLRLNSLGIDQIKSYLLEYTNLEKKYLDSLSKNGLLQTLADETGKNNKLQLQINSLKVTYKPSFFILAFNSAGNADDYKKNLKLNLNKDLSKLNSKLNTQSGIPVYKNFEYIDSKIENGILEFHIVWQKLHWYWSPDSFSLDKIYELNYGISIIDFNSKKAIISCHTVEEKDFFVKIVKDTFGLKLNTLVLTKPLLEKIGSYDKVKRARYFLSKDTTKLPENITYADDKLSIKPPALELENNPNSERKESFYRIPLGKVPEQGVGVTSDSGKLWISKNYPIDDVKEFGLGLLAQIAGTLDVLIKNGNFKTVFDTLGIQNLPEIQTITSSTLRNEITRLIFELLLMLLKKDTERPFTIDEILVNSNSIPKYFNFPRLDVYDSEIDSNGFYTNDSDGSQLIKIINRRNELVVFSFPSNETLNLDYLEHPISHNPIKVNDLYSSIELIPTPELQKIIDGVFAYLNNQFPELAGIDNVPFRIKSNKLILGLSIISNVTKHIKNTEIFASDIVQLKQVVNKTIPTGKEAFYSKILYSLNEKCNQCSDQNCLECPRLKKYVCLRSLVGEFLKHPYILSHKGIELSDIQGRLDLDNKEIVVYGFSKQTNTKSLTAKNNPGAVLLAQIIGQIDKQDFDVVLIITPNTLSDDLYNRLRLICNVFEKKLLVFHHETLKFLLNEYEIRIAFNSKEITEIYRASNSKLKKLNPKK